MRRILKMNLFRNLVIVGCGGTGGYLIPKLFRHISTIPYLKNNLRLFLIDNDIVELKNVGRQNFIASDIGQSKAEVLARRYGNAFGLNVNCILERADSSTYREIPYADMLIIDAVDNNMARNEIWSFIKSTYSDVAWISAGNSKEEGQVVVYIKDGRSVVTAFPNDFTEESLKKEAEEEAAISCAEHNMVDPQSIAANETAASIIYNICHQTMHQGYIEHDVIFFDIFNKITRIGIGEPLLNISQEAFSDIAASLI